LQSNSQNIFEPFAAAEPGKVFVRQRRRGCLRLYIVTAQKQKNNRYLYGTLITTIQK